MSVEEQDATLTSQWLRGGPWCGNLSLPSPSQPLPVSPSVSSPRKVRDKDQESSGTFKDTELDGHYIITFSLFIYKKGSTYRTRKRKSPQDCVSANKV